MDFYLEYPIRCKTCNDQIACFSYEYEQYLNSGYSVQQALDQLGITNYCCRISMKDPVEVTFNMENREVIEGLKKIEEADDMGFRSPNDSEVGFGACISEKKVQETKKPIKPLLKGIQPVAPVDLTNVAPIGEGIEITIPSESDKFNLPVNVGISTINRTSLGRPETRPVGTGKESQVLSGRTYLAR